MSGMGVSSTRTIKRVNAETKDMHFWLMRPIPGGS